MEAKANLLQESSSGSTAMWEAAGHNQISMITCILRHDSEYTENATRDAGSSAFLVEHANQVIEWLSHMHGCSGASTREHVVDSAGVSVAEIERAKDCHVEFVSYHQQCER